MRAPDGRLRETSGLIEVRGLKVLEDNDCVSCSCVEDVSPLCEGVCSPLALNKINLTLLTSVPDRPGTGCRTLFCAARSDGVAHAALLGVPGGGMGTVSKIGIFSVFPHHGRPSIIGAFIGAFAEAGLTLYGFASSPSAVSTIIPITQKERAVQALFGRFRFASFVSPADFLDSLVGPDEHFRSVIASFQEKIARIYWIEYRDHLDLWEVSSGAGDLSLLASAVRGWQDMNLEIAFLAGAPGKSGSMDLAFCLRETDRNGGRLDERALCLDSFTEKTAVYRTGGMAAVYLHGPHFGDRYGIANTLVSALEGNGISIEALSCTVSSMSAVISRTQLKRGIAILEQVFHPTSPTREARVEVAREET